MRQRILLRCPEITLKGRNQGDFRACLHRNVRSTLRAIGVDWSVRSARGRVYVEAGRAREEEVRRAVAGAHVDAHVPAAAWGTAWLERGTLRARFVRPVYEGDEVEVVPGEPSASDEGPGGAIVVPLEVRTAAGTCAGGEAGLPAEPPPAPARTQIGRREPQFPPRQQFRSRSAHRDSHPCRVTRR